MSESIHQFVVEKLQSKKGQWPAIAQASGVPRRTLEKIASGESEDPRISAIDKLVSYFSVKELVAYLSGRRLQ